MGSCGPDFFIILLKFVIKYCNTIHQSLTIYIFIYMRWVDLILYFYFFLFPNVCQNPYYNIMYCGVRWVDLILYFISSSSPMCVKNLTIICTVGWGGSIWFYIFISSSSPPIFNAYKSGKQQKMWKLQNSQAPRLLLGGFVIS